MDARARTAASLQREALDAELSENTRTAYQKGWSRFIDYCVGEGIADPLSASPEQVSQFFVHLATQPNPRSGVVPSMGTVMLYKSAVNRKYTEAGRPAPSHHPVVTSTLKGLARLKGSAPRRVDALREYHIEAMLQSCPSTPIGMRDAAIIAVGFAGALRRSEICALEVEDVEFLDDDGQMWLTIRQSKTDQQGRGQRVAVQDGDGIQPIRRLKRYLGSAGIAEGPLFQTMRRGGHLRGRAMHHSDIPRILKHYAALIGLNPRDIAGHSLRAGFVTSAAVHHARLDKIMAVTRHRNPSTVMAYIRDVDAFADHAGQGFL